MIPKSRNTCLLSEHARLSDQFNIVANGPGIIYRDIPSGGIFEAGLHISTESILRFEHHMTLELRITIHEAMSDLKSVTRF